MSVKRQLVREAGWAALSGALALALAVWAFGVTWGDLSLVWGEGDLLPVYSYAESMSRGHWFLTNPDLGYPAFQDHGHFPVTDLVSIAQIGLLAQIAPSPIMALNLFTLGTFFSVAATFYLAVRFIGVGTLASVVTATIFSVLPWHFSRAGGHAFLASYMSVGLALFLVALVASRQLDRRKQPWMFAAALTAAALTGANGVYYALMTTMLLVVVIVVGTVGGGGPWPRWRTLVVSAMVPMSTLVAVVINRVSISTTSTAENVVRSPHEAYLHGGNLATLFFPARSSRTGNRLSGLLNLDFPWTAGEGDAMLSSAAVAAVLVASWMVATRWSSNRAPLPGSAVRVASFWPGLFVFVVAAFVASGLGALFSYWVSSDIRAWGRYSIFAVGISLLITGLVITAAHQGRSRTGRMVATSAILGLAFLAVLDVSGGRYRLPLEQLRSRAAEVSSLVAAMEDRTDRGCPILELPLTAYPEEGAVNRMPQYSHLLPYIYSEDLRWSYGAFKGTTAGGWSLDVKDDPFALLERSREAGFCGILVDTWAYGSVSESVDEAAAFGDPEYVSSTGRWAFFDLSGPLPGEYAIQPAVGFVPAADPASPQAWWMVAESGSITVRGAPDTVAPVLLRLASPPCGPVEVSVDARPITVDGVQESLVDVELDSEGLGSIAMAAKSGSCTVAGEPVPVFVGLNYPGWTP